MNCGFLIFTLLTTSIGFTQNNSIKEKKLSINQFIDGTLSLSETESMSTLAIFISDYGPTDRDGNQNFSKNNALKKLAFQLSEKGIATFRYDKRTLKQLRDGQHIADTSFNDFVTDAKSVLSFFQSQNQFSKIIIIGHGQGSLVGMLACNEQVSGFVSIGGSAKNIGDVIIDQIHATARQYTEETKEVVQTLKQGKTTTTYPKALGNMFSQEIQPFMISWMAYNPLDVIKDLQIPVLIINGTKDLQVKVDEAITLKGATSKGDLKIIEHMNHVLVKIEGDDLENSKSYNEPQWPIHKKLVPILVDFFNKI